LAVAAGVERRGARDFHGAIPSAARLGEWHRNESAGKCRGGERTYSNPDAKVTVNQTMT
jgi:hypothetical protein